MRRHRRSRVTTLHTTCSRWWRRSVPVYLRRMRFGGRCCFGFSMCPVCPPSRFSAGSRRCRSSHRSPHACGPCGPLCCSAAPSSTPGSGFVPGRRGRSLDFGLRGGVLPWRPWEVECQWVYRFTRAARIYMGLPLRSGRRWQPVGRCEFQLCLRRSQRNPTSAIEERVIQRPVAFSFGVSK